LTNDHSWLSSSSCCGWTINIAGFSWFAEMETGTDCISCSSPYVDVD
jgi:hypothetical protein